MAVPDWVETSCKKGGYLTVTEKGLRWVLNELDWRIYSLKEYIGETCDADEKAEFRKVLNKCKGHEATAIKKLAKLLGETEDEVTPAGGLFGTRHW